MRHRNGSLLVVSAVLLLSACASSVPLDSNFWSRKGERVGVAIAELPEARAHRVGGEMLLDAAINKAMASKLNARMSVIGPTMMGKVTDGFVAQLEQHGFDARRLKEEIDLEAYPKFSGEGKVFGRDLRTLGTQQDLDLLLLVTVNRYGTLRNYFGFVPTGAPKALFDVRGQLIDLKTNQLLWQTFLSDDEATVAVEGEWSEPPDYPNLVAALEKATAKSMAKLESNFFATRP